MIRKLLIINLMSLFVCNIGGYKFKCDVEEDKDKKYLEAENVKLRLERNNAWRDGWDKGYDSAWNYADRLWENRIADKSNMFGVCKDDKDCGGLPCVEGICTGPMTMHYPDGSYVNDIGYCHARIPDNYNGPDFNRIVLQNVLQK